MGEYNPYQNIEDKLSGLVPSALSEGCLDELDLTIDSLASGAAYTENGCMNLPSEVISMKVSDEEPENRSRRIKRLWQVVAVLAFITVLVVYFQPSSTQSIAAVENIEESALVILNTTNRVDSLINDGLILSNNGVTPYFQYRYEMMNQEQVIDADTGLIVTVSQPSQEVHTVPVNLF